MEEEEAQAAVNEHKESKEVEEVGQRKPSLQHRLSSLFKVEEQATSSEITPAAEEAAEVKAEAETEVGSEAKVGDEGRIGTVVDAAAGITPAAEALHETTEYAALVEAEDVVVEAEADEETLEAEAVPADATPITADETEELFAGPAATVAADAPTDEVIDNVAAELAEAMTLALGPAEDLSPTSDALRQNDKSLKADAAVATLAEPLDVDQTTVQPSAEVPDESVSPFRQTKLRCRKCWYHSQSSNRTHQVRVASRSAPWFSSIGNDSKVWPEG